MASLTIGKETVKEVTLKKGDIWNIVLTDANFTLSKYIGYCDGNNVSVDVIKSPTVYSVLRGDINVYVNNKLITCTSCEYFDNGIYDFGLSTSNINLDCKSGGTFEVYSSSKWYVCGYAPSTLNVVEQGSVVTVTDKSSGRITNGYVNVCSVNGMSSTVRVIKDTCEGECNDGVFPSTEYLAFTDNIKTINLTILSQCGCVDIEPTISISNSNVTLSKRGNYYSFTYNGTTPFSGTVATISNECGNKVISGSYTVSSDDCTNSTFTASMSSYAFTKDNYLSAAEISAVSSTNIWRIESSDERLNCIKMGNRLYVSLKSYEDGTANVTLKDKCNNTINIPFTIPTGLTDTNKYEFYLSNASSYSSSSTTLTALTSSGDKPNVYLLSTHLDEQYPWSVKSNDTKVRFTLYHGGNAIGNRITTYSGGSKETNLQFEYASAVTEVGSEVNKIYVVPDANSLNKIINGYVGKLILQQDTTYKTVNIVYEFAPSQEESEIISIRAVGGGTLPCSGGTIPTSNISVYATTRTTTQRGEIEETETEVNGFTISPTSYTVNTSSSSLTTSVTVTYDTLTTNINFTIGTGCEETPQPPCEESDVWGDLNVTFNGTASCEGGTLNKSDFSVTQSGTHTNTDGSETTTSRTVSDFTITPSRYDKNEGDSEVISSITISYDGKEKNVNVTIPNCPKTVDKSAYIEIYSVTSAVENTCVPLGQRDIVSNCGYPVGTVTATNADYVEVYNHVARIYYNNIPKGGTFNVVITLNGSMPTDNKQCLLSIDVASSSFTPSNVICTNGNVAVFGSMGKPMLTNSDGTKIFIEIKYDR